MPDDIYNKKIIKDDIIYRYPFLESCQIDTDKACHAILQTYQHNGKIVICGNGGSCADAEHIAGELMKGFLKRRPLKDELRKKFEQYGGQEGIELAKSLQTPLRAIPLCGMPALSTAVMNDIDPYYVYAQQALGLVDEGDIFWGISTSGNARNVHCAAIAAKSLGAVLIGLTGREGGLMNNLYDIVIKVPETETCRIQELHVGVYHAICMIIEKELFGEET